MTQYRYDGNYQLLHAGYPGAAPYNGEVHSWTYDAIGNRLTSTANGATTVNTYQKVGKNPNNWQRLLNDGANAYTYDNNGNTLTQGANTYGWDYENRMTSIAGPATATYRYDYQGRRTSKTVAGVTTTYLYNGMNLIAETGASYLFGPGIDQPLAVERGGSVAYYAADGLGSIQTLTDAAGATQNTYAHDAWGAPRAATELVSQPFRYTGREAGDVSGHWFYRARYYTPHTGRFLSEDAKRWSDPLRNLYRYSGNAPTAFVDPMGTNYIPLSPVWNLDRTPYIGYGDTGPNSSSNILPILARYPNPSPIAGPNIAPSTLPWWDVDFICTPSGWKKIKTISFILGGKLYSPSPATNPPPEWKPPFKCPKDKCPI